MMKIFAKKGTVIKAVVPCPKEAIGEVMKRLNNKYGGDWVYVDKINPGEGIMYEDGLNYKGFCGEMRYSDAIFKC